MKSRELAGTVLTLRVAMGFVSNSGIGRFGAPLFVAWGVMVSAAGGVVHLLSAVAMAVRDIARNSYRR